jgi:hypothetical protein
MKCRESQSQEREMSSAEMASGYVRRMVERESRGWGDQENALARLEAKYGIPFWSLQNLRTGRAKTVEAGLFSRVRSAYLDLCERQVSQLQHEIAVEKAMHGGVDATLEDLEREAAELARKIAAKKAASKARR